jgi:GT2 family glycosyltransferase
VDLFVDGDGPAPAWVRTKWLEGPQPVYFPSCLLVRRGLLQQVGVFDPALHNGSDVDWFARVRDAGVEVVIAPELLVRYRVHSANQSQFVGENQTDLYAIARKAVLRKRLLNAK